ncbi:hypothetical protein [Kribbella sindirgiensis]|uniref:Ricin B lectin domain-containing protein n=1 Tax=Kribbella sindirgiensis TaxID=1124744 RepID=A0A4R0J9L0_9ACTN|nr:hypothetical protein [Kribbella sindirgiensis]TCC43251.1 hypothetical protein E0H50_01855 [Kribbella sindirgiensis]
MQVTRKIVAAAAVATVATLGLATVVSANVLDDAQQKAQVTGLADAVSSASKGYDKGHARWWGMHKDGSLVAIDRNDLGAFQACHNLGAGTGIGGTVPANDITGIVGWGNDGNSVTAVKTCEQENEQNRKWYKADGNGVVSVSDNKVGPWQVCHNQVDITGIGGTVPLSNPTGILGLDNDGNSVDSLKTCEQSNEQNN